MWKAIKSMLGMSDAAAPVASQVQKPMALGLGVGMSFKLSPLMIKSLLSDLTVTAIAPEQIVKAAGTVDMDGVTVVRLYTDDDAWLQVVFDGAPDASNVVDITLFHYYDTLSINNDSEWDRVFQHDVAKPAYTLKKDGETLSFTPVWGGSNGVSAPVRLEETCYDETDEPSRTLQCAMLYQRPLPKNPNEVEVLFVAAEQRLDVDAVDRCLVISTGIKLAIHQIET